LLLLQLCLFLRLFVLIMCCACSTDGQCLSCHVLTVITCSVLGITSGCCVLLTKLTLCAVPAGSAEYAEAQSRAMQQLAHKTYEEARFKAPRELVAGMGTDEDEVLDAATSAVKAEAEEAAAAAAAAAKPSKKRKKVAGGVSEEAAVAAAAVAAAEAAAANATVARQAAALANKRRKTGSGKASKAEAAAAALVDGGEEQQQQGGVTVKQEDGAVAASPAKQKSARGKAAAAAAAQQQQDEGELGVCLLVVCRKIDDLKGELVCCRVCCISRLGALQVCGVFASQNHMLPAKAASQVSHWPVLPRFRN
jgi:hypothetical protein